MPDQAAPAGPAAGHAGAGNNEGRPLREAGDRPSSGARREGDVWGDVRGRLDVTASARRFDAADTRQSGRARPSFVSVTMENIEPGAECGHLAPTAATAGGIRTAGKRGNGTIRRAGLRTR